MTSIRIALTTVSTREEGQRIAHALVEHRLAACVNILDGMHSVYRWQGAMEEQREFLLIIKTDADHLRAVETAVHTLHSYELPEFLVFAPEGGSAAYLQWIAQSLAAPPLPEK